MLLCDIGNTSYHFLHGKRRYKKSCVDFDPSTISQKVYYICVNPKISKKLNKLSNWINLAKFVKIKKYYKTMGIDRVFACEAIHNGVIVDAGSAITVDVVRDGQFEGGFILPGLQAMKHAYTEVSTALDYRFNFGIDFLTLPRNSQDAISYAYLKVLYTEVSAQNLEIFLTGGDAGKLKKVFPNAEKKGKLLFKGMKKIIKKVGLE